MADADTSMNANQSDDNNSNNQDDYFDPDIAVKVADNLDSQDFSKGNGSGINENMNAIEDISDQKQCPQCTLYNHIDGVICDICEFVFP